MMTLYIDKIINFCKWPFAIVCCLAIHPIVMNFIDVFEQWYATVDSMFWVGLVGYGILYRYVFSARMWGSWLPTFEHELTHAIFAVATLHRVTDFHASYKKGGHIQYVGGEGNWLITIAPYIFPTFLFSVILLFPYLIAYEWVWIFFGAVFAFQYISTYGEIHSHQPDLQKVGFFFASIVIPVCNLLSMSMVMAWMNGGLGHVISLLSKILQGVEVLMNMILIFVNSNI
jgi:hypothetical protein